MDKNIIKIYLHLHSINIKLLNVHFNEHPHLSSTLSCVSYFGGYYLPTDCGSKYLAGIKQAQERLRDTSHNHDFVQ